MSLCRSDLQDCLEGVIPSIIATTPADGVPNVSYLSRVKEIDDHYIAQSNQFFGKTARNLRDNPQARVILVDACSGRQAQLAVTWLRDEAMTASLRASSAQVGMVDIMRLASVAAFRVDAITVILHPEGLEVQSNLSHRRAPAWNGPPTPSRASPPNPKRPGSSMPRCLVPAGCWMRQRSFCSNSIPNDRCW